MCEFLLDTLTFDERLHEIDDLPECTVGMLPPLLLLDEYLPHNHPIHHSILIIEINLEHILEHAVSLQSLYLLVDCLQLLVEYHELLLLLVHLLLVVVNLIPVLLILLLVLNLLRLQLLYQSLVLLTLRLLLSQLSLHILSLLINSRLISQ
jgi:hypothetical protein